MNKLTRFLAITALTLIGNTAVAQTEDYYTNANCKILYFEVNSSKIKIFYGNGMQEEVSGDRETLVMTLSNTFMKSGYELVEIMPKMLSGESIPGYFFFKRKSE